MLVQDNFRETRRIVQEDLQRLTVPGLLLGGHRVLHGSQPQPKIGGVHGSDREQKGGVWHHAACGVSQPPKSFTWSRTRSGYTLGGLQVS